MKANNRTFRKFVTRICGDLAGECMYAGSLNESADQEKLAEIIVTIARLQSRTIDRMGISFDKVPREFPNPKEYRKARRAYFAAAFKALKADFMEELKKVVDEMNKAVPRK
ncbi:MAG: hypothetical protein HUK14_03305 [Muribaculaceae bacterium]|nr:hypothetical protein [Muribaculaceae bacterium]